MRELPVSRTAGGQTRAQSDPLTDAELATCCEIANVIWQDAGTVSFTNSFGINQVLTEIGKLKQQIISYAQSLDDTGVAAVRDCVTAWSAVRFSTVVIDGDIGAVHGISYSAPAKRERIKEIFQVYIPVMTFAEGLKRRDQALRGNNVIPIG